MPETTRVCRGCGVRFGGRKKKFCTDECREISRFRAHYPPTDQPLTCSKCGATKPALEFSLDHTKSVGRRSQCRECLKPAYAAFRRGSKREAILAKNRRRAKKRTAEQRRLERAAAAVRNGKDYGPLSRLQGYAAHVKAWRERFDDAEQKAIQVWREWLRRAPQWWTDAYWQSNPKPWLDPRLSAAQKERLRRVSDPAKLAYRRAYERMKGALRKRGIRMEVFRKGVAKGHAAGVSPHLPYTAEELKGHIERQFTKGMTWDKFIAGDIHLDHIRPLRAFDLHNTDQFEAAWALPNLRPAWAKDNLAKGGREDYLL